MQSMFLVLLLKGVLIANILTADASHIISKRGLSSRDVQIVLDKHNEARRSVYPRASNMRLMTWSDELAAEAQRAAATCSGEHIGSGYGQNIFESSSRAINMAAAVDDWMNEKNFYDFFSNRCTPRGSYSSCGHYTQMIWATSTEVGCGAVNYCRGSFRTKVYCNYKPQGNILDSNSGTTRQPYKSGIPCSGCTDCGFRCENGLCVKGDTSQCGGRGRARACPPGKPRRRCYRNPCDYARCPRWSTARCVPDYCGGCKARFYVGNLEATDVCFYSP